MLTRIVKIGGSLLDWPLLPAALQRWLAMQPPAMHVLLCGGGAMADVIRRADKDFALGDEAAHWLCIDVLAVTARLLGQLLPQARLVTTYSELGEFVAAGQSGAVVFDPREFLRHRESQLPGRPLPRDWSVTSDSIAARLAEVVAAEELVLLKSGDPPGGSMAEWVAGGFVDGHFPASIVNCRKVNAVNLRR